MRSVVVCFIFLFIYNSQATTVQDAVVESIDPNTGLDITQLLAKFDYPLETHTTTTQDGYILTLHRIPRGKNATETDDNGPPVFLMHGLLCSSVDWVSVGPGNALALLLADQGYDVWLGNSRGNTWSRKHVTLDPDANITFWNFSFHEVAVYDIPANIDYILNVTGEEKVSYVSHSAGSTEFFVLMSTRSEYNDKIKIAATLSPVTYMDNVMSPIVLLLAKEQEVFDVVMSTYLKTNEFLPNSWILSTAVKYLCNDNSSVVDLCADFFYLLAGFDEREMNKTFLTVIASNTPAGTSVKVIDHYLQEIKSGHFRQFDYGIIGNMKQYNNVTPPDYNNSLVTAPVGIFYANNDFLNAPINVERLATELPNVVKKHLVEEPDFNHLDFIFAKHVYQYVNFHVINLLNSYNGFDEITTSTTAKPTTRTTASTPASGSTEPPAGGGCIGVTVSYIALCVCLLTLVFNTD